MEEFQEIALLELLEPRKGTTGRFKAVLGYKDQRTKTPHILVVNKNARGNTSREVKVLNEKRGAFLDNSKHSTRDGKKIKPADSSKLEFQERAAKANAGEEFEYRDKSYIKLSDDEVKRLCEKIYTRSETLSNKWAR